MPKATDDLNFWINSGNKAILKKIAGLTEAIVQSPYHGIGKPEALKLHLQENGLAGSTTNIDISIKSKTIS